jgi:DNA-binding NtrC family response regulator
VNSFLEKFSEANGKMRTISEDAIARMMAYDWPGNVRELENAIERAIALGSGPILHAGDLPTNLQYGTGDRLPQTDELLPFDELERARSCARCAKLGATSWLRRACWGSARPRCTAS